MSQSELYICKEVEQLRALHDYVFDDDFRRLPICEQLHQQAKVILASHQQANSVIVPHIGCWHPKLVGKSANEIMESEFTIDDALMTISREYGFADWVDAESRGQSAPDAEFERAVDAVVQGELALLASMLEANLELAGQRSAFGHASTLLHYVGSNGVETYRQIVPYNLADVTSTLIAAGSDVNATANMYGGGSTTIGLLTSSIHPAKAGVMNEVSKILVSAGAK